MNRKSFHSFTKWLPVTILVSALLACNLSPAAPAGTDVSGQNNLPTPIIPTDTTEPVAVVETETPTVEPIVHTTIPVDLPNNAMGEITDRDSSVFAADRRANGGENYSINLYERPFNANTMDTYFPDLDIIRARILADSTWVFVTIKLTGQNASGGLLENYGVELDLNVDGRGDVLVMAKNPGAAWSTDGVRAWTDNNHDVGAAHPIQSDAPTSGDGYETLVFDSGVGNDPDTAWARISPDDPTMVQIAFKSALINGDGYYAWGVWAISDSMVNPAWFDYNDHFTFTEAGSPLIEQTQDYPIKAFAEADNTCRWAVGFTPTGDEPGICPIPKTPTPVPPSRISGLAWYDYANDGIKNGADYGINAVSIRVRSGNCGAPGGTVATTTTNSSGNYTVTVQPGTYCVDYPTMPAVANSGSGPVTVTVAVGGTGHADFRFWYIIF